MAEDNTIPGSDVNPNANDPTNATGAPTPLTQENAGPVDTNTSPPVAAADSSPAKPKKKTKKQLAAEATANAAASGTPATDAAKPAPEKRIYVKMEPEAQRIEHIDALSFDPTVQMRTKKFDEPTVEKYRGIMEERGIEIFPPLRAIELPEHEVKDGKRLIVWDGHQRGEAIKRISPEKLANDKKTVRVLVSKGNRNLARRLAAGVNAEHGLPRSPEDLRKALRVAVEDKELLEEIGAAFKGLGREGGGGMMRALAATCDCSKDSVHRILRDLGLKTAGDKVIALTEKEKAEWAAQKNGGTPTPPTESTGTLPGMSPEQADRQHKLDALAKQTSPVLLKSLEKDVVDLQMVLERLCERPDILPVVEEVFAQLGQPLSYVEEVSTDGSGTTTRKAVWTVMDFVADAIGKVVTKFMFNHQASAAATDASADKGEDEVKA